MRDFLFNLEDSSLDKKKCGRIVTSREFLQLDDNSFAVTSMQATNRTIVKSRFEN